MTINPKAKPIVAILLCLPILASGINSSTTTYIIAPAAKANKYGIVIIKYLLNNIVTIPAIGSTIPLNCP